MNIRPAHLLSVLVFSWMALILGCRTEPPLLSTAAGCFYFAVPMASDDEINDAVVRAAGWARYKQVKIRKPTDSAPRHGMHFIATNPSRDIIFLPGSFGKYVVWAITWTTSDVHHGKEDLELLSESLAGAFGPRFHQYTPPDDNCSVTDNRMVSVLSPDLLRVSSNHHFKSTSQAFGLAGHLSE